MEQTTVAWNLLSFGICMAASSSRIIIIFSNTRGIAQILNEKSSNDLITNWHCLGAQEIQDDAPQKVTDEGISFYPEHLNPTTSKRLQETEILITEPATIVAILKHNPGALPNLKWWQSTFAGVDAFFDAGLPMPLPFTLTRMARTFGQLIAEWCLARIISHERTFDLVSQDQTTRTWAGNGSKIRDYRCLTELTLVILGGCGKIGQTIANSAKYGFGMKTIVFSRTSHRGQEIPDGFDLCMDQLSTALQEADYLLSVLPSTQVTKSLLSTKTCAACGRTNGGKSPVFLNVERGDVTDEKSLVDNGFISAAILDVFEKEPLPTRSPLWSRDDVIVSSHVSVITMARDLPELFLKNYDRYVSGKELCCQLKQGLLGLSFS